MVTVEDFSRLVAGIYAAAVTPQQWESALGDVVRTLDGTGGGLVFTDGSSRWQLAALPPDAVKSYAEHYWGLDHVLAAVEKGPVGAVRTGDELIPSKPQTEFHADWIRPNGLEDGLFVRLNSGMKTSCLVAATPRRAESFAAPERIKLMSGLVAHLRQALRTQDKLAALDHCSAGLLGAIEAVRHGVIIVESRRGVVHLNTAAEIIVRAGDGIGLRSGRIANTSTQTERRLNGALQAALDEDANVQHGRSFICERPSGKRPYVIHVLPLHGSTTGEPLNDATALVLIIDPEQENQAAPALLRQLYKLTNTEAEIAVRLTRGDDLKEISDELSVSLTTVRTHLQHLFEKTNTHRQAELVRHLLAVSPSGSAIQIKESASSSGPRMHH